MDTTKDLDQTQALDPHAEALRSMISSLLDEKLEALRVRIEEDAKARYVDLRAHLSKVQASLDILNNKFDAQADEVKFLRKGVRALEDKAEETTV